MSITRTKRLDNCLLNEGSNELWNFVGNYNVFELWNSSDYSSHYDHVDFHSNMPNHNLNGVWGMPKPNSPNHWCYQDHLWCLLQDNYSLWMPNNRTKSLYHSLPNARSKELRYFMGHQHHSMRSFPNFHGHNYQNHCEPLRANNASSGPPQVESV